MCEPLHTSPVVQKMHIVEKAVSSTRTEISVLSFSFSRFLIGELHLGKLSEMVIVHGNAPHDRPRSLVSHLIGNRASFPCTKAPTLRVPDKVSEWHRSMPRRA